MVFREVPRRHLVSNLIPVAKNLFLSEESRLSTRSRREGKPMASEEKLVVLYGRYKVTNLSRLLGGRVASTSCRLPVVTMVKYIG